MLHLQACHRLWPPPPTVHGGLCLGVLLFFLSFHRHGDWGLLWRVINLTLEGQCLIKKVTKHTKVIKELYPSVKWVCWHKLSIKLMNSLKVHQNDPKMICSMGTYHDNTPFCCTCYVLYLLCSVCYVLICVPTLICALEPGKAITCT